MGVSSNEKIRDSKPLDRGLIPRTPAKKEGIDKMQTVKYYSATWCQPCKTYGPLIEEASNNLGIDIDKILIDDLQFEELEKANVSSVPTLVFGDERLVGAKPVAVLYDWLKRVVKNESPL